MNILVAWSICACAFVFIQTVHAVVTTNETVYGREGGDITLSCSGVVNARVSWSNRNYVNESYIVVAYDNLTADPDKYSATSSGPSGVYTFTIHHFMEASDARYYRCQMSLDRWLEKIVQITIIQSDGPLTASITGNNPVFADGYNSLILMCNTDTATPGATYEWRNGETVISGITTGTLILSPVQPLHDGAEITCTAINFVFDDIRVTSQSATLTVYYGIHSTDVSVLPVQISEGGRVAVKCTSHGNPSPTYTFFKDLEVLTHNSSSDVLEISNISRSDAGLYQCRAENQYKFETVEIAINVRYAPDITMMIPASLRTNDEDVSISCTASGNPAEYTFGQWIHLDANNHTPIRFLAGIQNGSIFQLEFRKPLTHQDIGNYRCTVHNGVIGTNGQLYQAQTRTLAVKGQPYIYKETGSFFGDIGHRSYVEVYFNSYPVYSHVTWFVFDGDGHGITAVELNGGFETRIKMGTLVTEIYDVTVNVSAYVAILLIKNVTEDDFKKYHVIIVNEMGQSQKTVELTELVKTANNCACSQCDSVVGAVLGSVFGTLLLVLIVHVVVWKMGILKISCSGNKEKKDPNHIYQNRSFDTVGDVSADGGENAYQPVGPEENPNLHYQTLDSVTTR